MEFNNGCGVTISSSSFSRADQLPPDFRLLFESVPGLYLVLTPDLRIAAASDAYLDATMTLRKHIIGQYLFDVFPDNPDDASATGVKNVRASLERVLKEGVADTIAIQKYDIRRPETERGGFEERYWSGLHSPIVGSSGRVEHIILRIEDVTDFILLKQKRAAELQVSQRLKEHAGQLETELYLRAQELEALNRNLRTANDALAELYEKAQEIDTLKTQFFSNISHEFRTPLTLILSPSEEMLRAPGEAFVAERSALEPVRRNGLRLLRIVNMVLDYSRIEAGRLQARFEASDLSALTSEYTSAFRSTVENGGLFFDVRLERLDEPVYVDQAMWERIVFNLLSNAFKFTLKGGITVRLVAAHSFARLSVEDTGLGIPAPEIPRIFERFHRVEETRGRTYEGTGIGLALVRELVRLHGGSIDVKSRVNQGTVFMVSIPLGTGHFPAECVVQEGVAATPFAQAAFIENAPMCNAAGGPVELSLAAAGPEIPANTHGGDDRKGRIVLADDNPDMRAYITRLLSEAGYEVDAAGNGEEALNSIREARPDVVLSDVMMPVKDGLQLVRELRNDPATSTIPVILLTARGGEEALIEGLETGVDDYLVKPFTARQLLARVASHVELARVREAATAKIRQNELRLRQVLEAVPEAIFEVDSEGRILSVNQAAAEMFGYNTEQFVTLGVEDLIPEAQRAAHVRHRLAYEHTPKKRPMGAGLELTAKKKDGSRFPVEISLSPSSSGGVFKVIASVRDITERRRAEIQIEAQRAQLASSARLAALGAMAGGVAHEINNPLAIIHAAASQLLSLAKRDRAPLERVVRNSERILQTANRINRIVKAMRQVAREGSHDSFCPAKVAKIVDEALDLCRERFAHHSVELMVPDIDPSIEVSCREVQIGQVILNLVQNAFDAVRDQAARRWVRIEVESKGGSVVFSVIDSGPGIPQELKSRVMEPFFTTKEVSKGTGLGLSISRSIVEEHGGVLELGERGGHTCVSFTLPVAQVQENICD